MSAVFSGNTTPCNDFDINAGVLNSALQNAEILNQGQLQLTLIDGTIVINNIPYFVDYIITGVNLTQESVPNLNEINYTSGTYQINAQQYTLALPGTIFCDPSDPTFDRIDLIYLDTLGNINYLPGLAVLNPVVPATPPNCLKVAEIGVEAGATGSSGYTLTSININSVITSAGFLENQTLRWNSVSGKWVPTSGLLTNTARQTVIGGIAGFGGMDALTKLQVGGAINIENNSAPTPTTNKLYAIAGVLYWNGIPIGVSNIVAGTSIGNTLYWDGTQWNETGDFKRVNTGFGVDGYEYNTTDAGGVLTRFTFGESSSTGPTRGGEFFINDTLNNNDLNLAFTSSNGSGGGTSLEMIQNDQVSDKKYIINIDAIESNETFSLLSNPLQNTSKNHSYSNWEVNCNLTNTYFTKIQADVSFAQLYAQNGAAYLASLITPITHQFNFTNGLLTGDSVFTREGLTIRGNNSLITDVIELKSGGTGNNQFLLYFNALPIVDVQDDSIYLGRRLYLNRQLITAGNYIIDSGLLVTNYIITDDTASNTITLPTITGTNSGAIIKIARQNSTNNFNKQLITLGGATFANTVGLVTYNLANINESVTLQADFSLNTWFIIDTSNKIKEISQRNTAISTAVQLTDEMIIATAAPLTITLPAAPTKGRTLTVISNGVATGGNPITINGNGKNINAAATSTITTAYGKNTLTFNTTLNKWLIIVN